MHEHSGSGLADVLGRPELFVRRHPLAMVYGGGGVFGVGYTAGVAAGLLAAGLPVREAPALGTSAGAWTAAALALGMTYDDFAGFGTPRLPTRRVAALADLARQFFGEATDHRVAVSAVSLRSRRRHILDGGSYPLADLVAASSAVPGLLPPYPVDGRLYVDGGMWSAASVDAAAEADHVIVVAPLAGRVIGPLGAVAGFLLDRELRRWQERNPEATVTLVHPDRAMARVAGFHPWSLFDDARAREIYPMAVEQGAALGRDLLRSWSTDVDSAEPAA